MTKSQKTKPGAKKIAKLSKAAGAELNETELAQAAGGKKNEVPAVQ